MSNLTLVKLGVAIFLFVLSCLMPPFPRFFFAFLAAAALVA